MLFNGPDRLRRCRVASPAEVSVSRVRLSHFSEGKVRRFNSSNCYVHNDFGVRDHGCTRYKNDYDFEFVSTLEKCHIGVQCCRGICGSTLPAGDRVERPGGVMGSCGYYGYHVTKSPLPEIKLFASHVKG